jgi:membrane-associated phospholipid phosphatase
VLGTLLVGGLRVLAGHDFPRRLQPLVVPTIAIAIGLGIELVMKTFFARSEVWPTYMKDGQYGFDLLHYRDGWRSFPSGTAIGTFALAGVLAVQQSRWRGPVLYASLAICAIVTMVTYHWLSDVTVGIFVGLTIGYAVAAILKPVSAETGESL